jgi:hypothetical protein
MNLPSWPNTSVSTMMTATMKWRALRPLDTRLPIISPDFPLNLGYARFSMTQGAAPHALSNMIQKARHVPSKEYYRDIRTCPQLERALQVLPPRPYTGMM